ncbi:hypothetical protein Trydic_g14098 [Trypoxylus dichotomus]
MLIIVFAWSPVFVRLGRGDGTCGSSRRITSPQFRLRSVQTPDRRPGHSGDEECRTIPSADRPQRTLVRPQPGATATWTGGARRRGTPDAPDGVVARFRGSPLRPHRSYYGDGGPIELEAAVRQVTERVSDSVRYATNTSRAVDDRAFIPREVRDLIREKNRLRKQWQRMLNLASKVEYNRMARRTKIALDEFRNDCWGDFMVRASETPSEFWRAVKALKGQRVPVSPIHGARGVTFTTEDKAEAFAETLERQCSPVYENVDVDRIGRIHRQVRDLLTAEENDEEPLRPTSPEEVKAIVKSFRPTKATGPDGITYRALKHAAKKFVMHMTNICNAMLRLRHFPSQWKLAGASMIPKPGQSHNWPQNYRPISLLPVMSKIADRIILTRLREETDDLDVIPGCQFGFRREHSTTHQVLRLVEHIKEGHVAKAFDKVGHRDLLLKMHRAIISRAMVKLIHSFLRKRAFQAKLEGWRSTTRTATAGLPHRRHPDNRARQPGDVRGRCLRLLQISQHQGDRPTSPDSTRHFAGLVRKVENRHPFPEKHGRAFRDRRSLKKEVRQRAGSHLPRRHHSLAT